MATPKNMMKTMWKAVHSRTEMLKNIYREKLMGYFVYGSLARGGIWPTSDIDAMALIDDTHEFRVFHFANCLFAEHKRDPRSFLGKPIEHYSRRLADAVVLLDVEGKMAELTRRYKEYHATTARVARDGRKTLHSLENAIKSIENDPRVLETAFLSFRAVKDALFFFHELDGMTGTSSRLLHFAKTRNPEIVSQAIKGIGLMRSQATSNYYVETESRLRSAVTWARGIDYPKKSYYQDLLSRLLEIHFLDTGKELLNRDSLETACYCLQFFTHLIFWDKGPFPENFDLPDRFRSLPANVFKSLCFVMAARDLADRKEPLDLIAKKVLEVIRCESSTHQIEN
jgi:predicted nucleotidyltransferase